MFFKNKKPNLVLNKSLSIPEVNKWVLSEFILNDLIPIVGYKPFPLDELLLMTSAMVRFAPSQTFDWGTHIGKSARIFFETNKKFNLGSKISTIDLPDDEFHVEHPGNKRGELIKDIKQIQMLTGDGVTEAVNAVSDPKKDTILFFLDGDHEYETVVRELDTINTNILNPIILVHDTFYQESHSGYNVGPFKAINEFLNKHRDYKHISTNFGLPGMTLLYKDPHDNK